ncbi:hypothetical protein MPL1032_180087 [Mesorhizobium plurifarium]|uniref:Uncharacterized protein n=1 Tax=Mesorhizobium plurifarium TaxID=69974 RepID=A0A0K2VTK4_MESPL|nr:hypothetical protein MPL1032_180087 [Mesorhizobium plurifarium]
MTVKPKRAMLSKSMDVRTLSVINLILSAILTIFFLKLCLCVRQHFIPHGPERSLFV